jgi:protoporphyrinogen oxidase
MGMFLREPVEIVERESHPGGTASSFHSAGYTFDFGPHIMFSRNRAVLDFMVASLGENVHQCRRKNRISFAGRLVKYPFENDLGSLPVEDTFECLRDFLMNDETARYPDPANLEEWLLARFGRGICERYLFPYNEKVWNIPVASLSMLWADRIPKPDPQDVLRSALGIETEGYLHQLFYHYPLRGGYQAISEAWARRSEVTYDYAVNRIERREAGGWRITDGRSPRDYDRLISTIPVHELVELVDLEIPDAVREAVASLIVNPLIVVSLGIEGVDEQQLTAVYFPERDFLVNRISFPATFSPHNAPPGTHSIQAEITCTRDAAIWKAPDSEAAEHVVSGLAARGLIANADAVLHSIVTRRQYAYVVYDVGYERRAQLVRSWFSEHNIELVGRFSFFEYVNVDGAVERALEVAGRLNGAPVRLEGGEVLA